MLLVSVAALVGYLLGSISFARIIARRVAPQADITRLSRPIERTDLVFEDDAVSATAVNLHVGARYGVLTMVCDMLKAALPLLLFRWLAPDSPAHLAAAAAAVAGHNWPIYYRFKGGRGESSIYGGVLMLDPLGALAVNLGAMLAGWALGDVRVLRYGGIVLLIPWMWARTGSLSMLAYAVAVAAMFYVSMRHELGQHLLYARRRVFASQEELSDFMDMGRPLGRFLDRYSPLALLRRLSAR